MRPRVKICGLTRPKDARLAVELGATHVGCVLAPGSPRCVSPERARAVFAAAGWRAQPVLVLTDADPAEIPGLAREAGTTHVQLYGVSESDRLRLEEAGLTVYRVHLVHAGATALPPLVPMPREGCPAVLDVGGGGSGRRFDWAFLGEHAPDHTFVAGGVAPENVGSLLAHRPYGIDLSSGVESEPGLKDPRRMALFFQAVERQR